MIKLTAQFGADAGPNGRVSRYCTWKITSPTATKILVGIEGNNEDPDHPGVRYFSTSPLPKGI